jgi:hypothetical protein
MKLGILTKSLGTSQEGLSIIIELNKFVQYNPLSEVIVFYDDYDRIPIRPHFPIMLSRHAWNYEGTLVATNTSSAQLLQHLLAAQKRYIYLWNLDWIYFKKPWQFYSNLYQDDNIELIARSNIHASIIEKLWKTPSHIMDNFNYEILQTL